MEITLLPGCEHPAEIGALFNEYTEMLAAGDPTFRAYLAVQHYDRELAHLEEKYGGDGARLWLLTCDGAPAGCIGLRQMDGACCEMKRLYVRPAYRGLHLGRMLAERIIADARAIGYRTMRLDTLPFLREAIDLYRKLGFYEIPCYNDSPMQQALYLELKL